MENCAEASLDNAEAFFNSSDETIRVMIGGAERNDVIQPYTDYTFEVFAINEAGASVASTESERSAEDGTFTLHGQLCSFVIGFTTM